MALPDIRPGHSVRLFGGLQPGPHPGVCARPGAGGHARTPGRSVVARRAGACVGRERARRADVESAQLRERSRMATEMHDGLGHRLSLLNLRTGGLEAELEATTPICARRRNRSVC
ncbi:histidine kinase [Streptomyces rectiverticillatus]|uniref:histidine kinase n=1 Tax=Streptomyces rectiverticillatus TaxID=173860 RepID=UPI001C4BD2CA